MATETSTTERGTASQGIGIGWRVFQVVALVVALSWIVSYLNMGGYAFFLQEGGPPGIPLLGDYIFLLSPIVSIVAIVLAVKPELLGIISERSPRGMAVRAVVLLLPLLWMINVFIGWTMVDKLITDPLGASKAVPVFGGVFFHVVFQHWFQSLAALVLALVPDQFESLTESPTPAGLQCAVVDCE